jgi:hypothetical protein
MHFSRKLVQEDLLNILAHRDSKVSPQTNQNIFGTKISKLKKHGKKKMLLSSYIYQRGWIKIQISSCASIATIEHAYV